MNRLLRWLAAWVWLASPIHAVAAEVGNESCRNLGPYYYSVPGVPGCWFFRTDAKAARGATSTPYAIDVTPRRNAKGPGVSYGSVELGPDRPLATWQFELKPLLGLVLPTEYGPLSLWLGAKAQLETPPRKPNDPADHFKRTGERVLLDRTGLEFAGFTFGVMPSFFDFTPSLAYTTLYASELSLPLAAYTFKIGRTDFTLSIEDGSERQFDDAAWGVYRNRISPDVVIAARNRQGWGATKLAAAIHPVRAYEPLGRSSAAGVGWATLAGLESWFDVGDRSAEFLINIGASKGALSYLGVSDYPADVVFGTDGRLYLNEAQAAVISGALWWTKSLRSILTLSAYRTDLDADTFSLRTSATQIQTAFEFYPDFVPRRALLAGIEISYHWDRVQGTGANSLSDSVSNRYFTTLIYSRLRF